MVKSAPTKTSAQPPISLAPVRAFTDPSKSLGAESVDAKAGDGRPPVPAALAPAAEAKPAPAQPAAAAPVVSEPVASKPPAAPQAADTKPSAPPPAMAAKPAPVATVAQAPASGAALFRAPARKPPRTMATGGKGEPKGAALKSAAPKASARKAAPTKAATPAPANSTVTKAAASAPAASPAAVAVKPVQIPGAVPVPGATPLPSPLGAKPRLATPVVPIPMRLPEPPAVLAATGAAMMTQALSFARTVGALQARVLDHACAEMKATLEEVETIARSDSAADAVALQAKAVRRGFEAYSAHLRELAEVAGRALRRG
jgi:hypothetical protein